VRLLEAVLIVSMICAGVSSAGGSGATPAPQSAGRSTRQRAGRGVVVVLVRGPGGRVEAMDDHSQDADAAVDTLDHNRTPLFVGPCYFLRVCG
jgi:hypothetical protein